MPEKAEKAEAEAEAATEKTAVVVVMTVEQCVEIDHNTEEARQIAGEAEVAKLKKLGYADVVLDFVDDDVPAGDDE